MEALFLFMAAYLVARRIDDNFGNHYFPAYQVFRHRIEIVLHPHEAVFVHMLLCDMGKLQRRPIGEQVALLLFKCRRNIHFQKFCFKVAFSFLETFKTIPQGENLVPYGFHAVFHVPFFVAGKTVSHVDPVAIIQGHFD